MDTRLIHRSYYLDQVTPFIDKTDFIKVLTGVRRCGKSSLLVLLQGKLLARGVDPQNILYINFESLEFSHIKTGKDLRDYVLVHKPEKGRLYLFVDEIQEVKKWEKGVNSLRVELDVDMYITGSNSHLLSSELATYISGRYVSFEVRPLCFSEYLDFTGHDKTENPQSASLLKALDEYLAIGGFPGIVSAAYQRDAAYVALADLYASVLLKDVVKRKNIRNIDLLDRLAKYLFDNVGQLFSTNSIVKYLKNEKRTVDPETIHNYLKYFEEAMLMTRLSRYDVKGKEHFKTNEKIFPVDHALRHAVLGYDSSAVAATLENLVFNEIKRRGYAEISVGQLGSREIDFVASKTKNSDSQRVYIQVTLGIFEEQDIRDREFSPLEDIDDSFPKYVVSFRDGGDMHTKNNKGIGYVNLADFLLSDQW